MLTLLGLVHLALVVYEYIIILGVIMSWLVAFDVLNARNKHVFKAATFVNKVTDPALRPIRKVIKPIGGIDVSPIVLILAVEMLKGLIRGMMQNIAYG